MERKFFGEKVVAVFVFVFAETVLANDIKKAAKKRTHETFIAAW